MKIYLSGKISGLTDLNKPKFERYEILLRAKGYEVVNPHTVKHKEDATWQDYMRADLIAMLDCDMVAVHDDWQDSRGAMVEVLTAIDIGIPVVHARSLAVLGVFDNVVIEEKEITFKI